MRLLIGDDLDVRRTIKILCGVAIVLSATMLYEKFTSVNVYGLIAGHSIVPEIRNGSIRAQGPFHHAILAGTFGATLLPLFVWLWRSKKDRFLQRREWAHRPQSPFVLRQVRRFLLFWQGFWASVCGRCAAGCVPSGGALWPRSYCSTS